MDTNVITDRLDDAQLSADDDYSDASEDLTQRDLPLRDLPQADLPLDLSRTGSVLDYNGKDTSSDEVRATFPPTTTTDHDITDMRPLQIPSPTDELVDDDLGRWDTLLNVANMARDQTFPKQY